jgi:hypothetical protein
VDEPTEASSIFRVRFLDSIGLGIGADQQTAKAYFGLACGELCGTQWFVALRRRGSRRAISGVRSFSTN